MVKRTLTLATVCLFTLAMGCTTTQKYAAGGAAVGATVGGIWAANGGYLNAGEGAAVGAVTGGLVGALIGDARSHSEAWHDLSDEINDRDAQLAELQKKYGEVKTKLQACEADLEVRDRRIGVLEDQVKNLQDELAKCKGARIEITLLADVLFQPGSARLSAKGKEALNDAAERLQEHSGGNNLIMVEGHTDSDPISATRHLWQDNWDLAAGRALSVTRYLASKGIPAERLAAASFSEYQPVSDDKAQNRRAVIVVHTGWPVY